MHFPLSSLENLGHYQKVELMSFQPLGWQRLLPPKQFLALTTLFKPSLIYLTSKMVTPTLVSHKCRWRKVTLWTWSIFNIIIFFSKLTLLSVYKIQILRYILIDQVLVEAKGPALWTSISSIFILFMSKRKSDRHCFRIQNFLINPECFVIIVVVFFAPFWEGKQFASCFLCFFFSKLPPFIKFSP